MVVINLIKVIQRELGCHSNKPRGSYMLDPKFNLHWGCSYKLTIIRCELGSRF